MRRIAATGVALVLLLVPALAVAAEPEELVAGRFRPAGSLEERRNSHTATALPDGRVLVIGGGAQDGRLSAEIWDPESASFQPAGQLAKARTSHTATLLPDGRVLVVGGGRAVATAEIWDPVTMSFEPAGRLIQGRTGHTATLLPDGRVLIVGGWKRPGWLASAEIWDPATSSFAQTGGLAEARTSHTATLLPDGRVLVIGGHGADDDPTDAAGNLLEPDQPRALAETWDPDSGSFSPVGNLATARSQHSATLLPDGRVLVVGGWGRDGERRPGRDLGPADRVLRPGGLAQPSSQPADGHAPARRPRRSSWAASTPMPRLQRRSGTRRPPPSSPLVPPSRAAPGTRPRCSPTAACSWSVASVAGLARRRRHGSPWPCPMSRCKPWPRSPRSVPSCRRRSGVTARRETRSGTGSTWPAASAVMSC